MESRSVVAVCCLLVCLAPLGFARELPWYTQPGTPVTMESSGFVFHANLPKGWSLTTDHGIVPPPAFASSCHVRGRFYTDLDWNAFLESALRSTNGARAANGTRFVEKIGGHPAVSNRYVRDLVAVRDEYIDLSDLQPHSGAVWTFEGSLTQDGLDCESQFSFMISSATITRRR